MRFIDLCCLVPLSLLVLACQSTHSDAKDANPDKTEAKAKSEKGDDDKDAKEEKVKKKQRELDDARLQLTIARQETESADRKEKDDIQDAEYGMEKAPEALEQFQKVTRPLELAKAQLSYDRTKERAEESKQELEELMSMYKKEEFAALTKELVVNRGKKNLEFANRNLEQDETEMAHTRDIELPRKEKDLQMALQKADSKLREEHKDQEKLANENELKLRKAERAVDDAEKELEKLKTDKGDAKVAKP
jgi:hypothetical protein